MVNENKIRAQIPYVLSGTDFAWLGGKYSGKVRDNYSRPDCRVLITTDRLSCFDRVVTTVPFKGQVLNQMALYWFSKTSDIISNHIISSPDPNVMVVKPCDVLPVEVVVRGYLTGSAWRDYQAGNAISGIKLPPGMKASQKLPDPVITPSTKAAKGSHDMPVSEEEIVRSGLVERRLWEEVRSAALALFSRGQEEALSRGLLLVDTKYEFGTLNGRLLLVDEIHTLDSSRYWVKETYEKCFETGVSPQMLDKEPVRQWLLERGFKGDGQIPEFTEDYRVSIARHYIGSYEKICGQAFEGETGDVSRRVEASLKKVFG